MIYGYRCWNCGAIISEDELKYDDKWRRTCPRCGATSTKSHRIRIIVNSNKNSKREDVVICLQEDKARNGRERIADKENIN